MKFFNLAWAALLSVALSLPSILYANDCSSASTVSFGAGGCQTVTLDAVCDFGPSTQVPCASPAPPCIGDAWFRFVPGGTNLSQFNVQFDITLNSANTVNISLLYSESKELGDDCEWNTNTEGYTVYSRMCTEVVSGGVPIDFTVNGIDGSGTYFILVERVSGGPIADVTVCPTFLGNCAAPGNDRCSNAYALTAGNGIDPAAATGPNIPSWADAFKGTNACATKQRLPDGCSGFANSNLNTQTEDHNKRNILGQCIYNGNLGDTPPLGPNCFQFLENTVYYTFQVPASATDWYLHIGSTSQCSQEPNNIGIMLLENVNCNDARDADVIACNSTGIFGAIPSADISFSNLNLTQGTTYWIVIDGTRQSQCDFCILLGRGPDNPVLPVEFLSFDGIAQPTGHLLNWETRVEDGIFSFEIERSEDGQIFDLVGEMPSLGSVQEGASYSFLDENAPVGGSYYRIRTLDINGVESLSEVIYLHRSLEQAELYRLYPNPANDQVHLLLGIPDQSEATFTFLDMWGRRVYEESRSLASGNQEQTFAVSHLARGLYVLRIQVGNRTFLEKVLLD